MSKTIKFSHHYPKLHGQTSATLLAVLPLRINKDTPKEKRILELNGAHPLVEKLKGLEGDAQKDAIELLYDQALIAEGSPVADPARFAKLLTSLMLGK